MGRFEISFTRWPHDSDTEEELDETEEFEESIEVYNEDKNI